MRSRLFPLILILIPALLFAQTQTANIPKLPPEPAKARVKRIAMIEIPGFPGFESVALSNGLLLMAHSGADSLDVFDIAKRRLVAQVKDLKRPTGLALDEANGKVYVGNGDANSVSVISMGKWDVERTIPLQSPPDKLLLVPELKRLYVSSARDHSISLIGLQPGAQATAVSLGGRPAHMVFDLTRRQIFVTVQDLRQVAVLDPSLKVVGRYQLAASQPTGLALDAKARRLFVAVRYAVAELDADSGRELGRVAAPAGTDTLWLDQASGILYAAAGGGSVVIMRTPGRLAVDREFRTDLYAHTLAFDPARQMIFVPGAREGRSKLLLLKRTDVLPALGEATRPGPS